MAFDAEVQGLRAAEGGKGGLCGPGVVEQPKKRRDAKTIEALGPREPLRKPPTKGAAGDHRAVEAIATWHAGVAAPVVIEEEPEAEAPAPADKPQTMAEKLAEIKKVRLRRNTRSGTGRRLPRRLRTRRRSSGTGSIFAMVRTSMDFWITRRSFGHVGDDFNAGQPLPFPTGIDGDADDEALDGGEDLASDR